MSEVYRVGAYWDCRPESAQECARRAESFFRLLSQCHPTYARWYEKHNSVNRYLHALLWQEDVPKRKGWLPLWDKGSLLVLGPEPHEAANPEHLALGHRVQQVLKERGLLRRFPSGGSTSG
jgi:hypothetical protein